ncbi:MAG: hypothetical protein EAX96_16500 [Candidatus Lokiarchaeota archaeon]|nr:hypothetical protein [Candidatus Lokiarchaeota archaeon]
MKVLITAPFHEDYIKKMEDELNLEVIYESWMKVNKLYVGQQMVDKIINENFDILIIEADVINDLVFEGTKGKLKLIGVCRAWPTNVDVDAATKHNVPIINSPGRGGASVADLTIGLIINLLRPIVQADMAIKNKKWNEMFSWATEKRGRTLEGKKVGIVSLGAVGHEVARRLQGFDCEILVYDPYVSDDKLNSVKAKKVELEFLMSESDIITIHAPVLEETKGMITSKLISMMKKTAYFINTSRSAIIDEKAVLNAIKEEKIAGAAFDVYYKEPLGRANYFKDFFYGQPHENKNVILTTHIGGMTWESIITQSELIFQGVKDYLEGKRPASLYNKEVWK